MKKIIFLVSIIMLAISLFALDTVAIALKVKGDVELTRKEESVPTTTGDEFYNEDVLESKPESFAAIKFVDGSSLVKLFPNSVLTIKVEEEEGKLNKNNYLDMGDIWTKVTKKTGDFVVNTPTTVVSVKGTEFLLSVDETGVTDVFTFSGEVNMKNKTDGREVVVTKGQKARSKGEGDIQLAPIEKGDLNEEQQQMMDEAEEKVLEFQIKDESGDSKTIKIKFD